MPLPMWLGPLAGTLNQLNPNSPQNRLIRALQGQRTGFGQQPSTPSPASSLGPSWQPGGRGFGTYEGNIQTAANPYGGQTPQLGAPNTPSAAGAARPQGMPSPAGTPATDPWQWGAPPIPGAQLGSLAGQPSMAGLGGAAGQIPFGTAGGGLNALSSLGQASQAQNPMMNALFSDPNFNAMAMAGT